MDGHQLGTAATRGRPTTLCALRRRAARLLDTPPLSATSPIYAVVATAFHVTAGALGVAAAWLLPQTLHPVPITVIGVCGILTGIGSARYPTVLPEPAQRFVYFLGPAFVALTVILAGPNTAGRATFWLFCFMPIRAFLFFPWRWAAPMAAWAGVASAVTAFNFHIIDPAEWIVASIIGLVTTVAVSGLVYYAAEAEWEPITQMRNRKGFDHALLARCLDAGQTGRRFSLALIKVEPAASAVVDADPGADTAARRLADAWRPGAPAAAHWARIADLEFAVLWDGDSAEFPEYLERVRADIDWASVAIGFADYHRGDDRVAVLGAAYEGRAYSARAGGLVSRAGPVEAQVDELRQAVLAGQVVAHYQPIVDLSTGAVVGAEALARWQHPERGWVPPDEFIPLAEHAKLINLLGEQILRQACRDAAGWYPGGRGPAEVAVNVSGAQLHDPGFPAMVAAALDEAGLDAGRLTLEITESTIAADDAHVRGVLAQLRATGITIAIDDFGTGYSTASRLVNMPVDILKIDREFVRHLDAGHPVLQYMVALAAGIGLRTVVEGIERADQAAAVTAFGADCAQGWLFGRPVPNEEFALARPQRAPGPARSLAARPAAVRHDRLVPVRRKG